MDAPAPPTPTASTLPRSIPPASDRRTEHRDAVIGTLWMIDNIASTVIRCRCIDVSRDGMRLRVPLGYGVNVGQHYELCSHLPGQSQPPGLGLFVSRGATVVRADITVDRDEDVLDVGVALDADRTALVGTAATARTSARPA